MLAFLQNTNILQLYVVSGGVRRKEQAEYEWKNGIAPPDVDHEKYIDNVIDDLEEVVQARDGLVEENLMQNVDKIVSNKGVAAVHLFEANKTSKDKEKRKVSQSTKKRKSGKAKALVNAFAYAADSRNLVEVGSSSRGAVEKEMVKRKATGRKKMRESRYDTRFKGEMSYVDQVDDKEEEEPTSDSDDPTYEYLIDSDYELHPEDDEVLFKANVDGDPGNVNEYEDMSYEGNISDGKDEDSERFDTVSESSTSEDDEVRIKGERREKKRYSKWREFMQDIDLKNPHFELGMEFPNAEAFKDTVRAFSVFTKKELRFKKNDRKRVEVICKTTEGCPFRIWASMKDNSPTFSIKSMNMEHKCSLIAKKVYHCNAPFLVKGYLDGFIHDKKWSREGIQSTVMRDYGMEIGYQMCYRAKRRATKMAEGTVEDQYNLLESYAAILKKNNPDTSIWIDGNLEVDIRRFKRMYICCGALKKGWKEGCRPIIGLDGCHLKSVHKGQLLTAVGIDANNGMYPVAYAVVEKETRDSWTWFLKFLKEDLSLHNDYSYAFISDKQKGLELAIKELFPNSEHRHCVRHMYSNFKGDGNIGIELKNSMWAAARSTTKNHFHKNMDSIHEKSLSAWNWLIGKPVEHWSRSHFKTHVKCDILCNNHSESWNGSILEARKLPILGFFEELRINISKRLSNRRCAGMRWKSRVGPRIEKLLKKSADRSHEYTPLEFGYLRFQIQGKGVACASGVNSLHDVNLAQMTCTCKRWDLNGLPCPHAIAAIFSKKYEPYQFVDEAYSQEKYMLAYEPQINPIPGVDEWDVVERPIAPPKYTRGPERPKMSRNKEPNELPPSAGTTKLPKSYYSNITCSMCKKKGHNMRTCARRNASNVQTTPNDAGNVNEVPSMNANNVETTPSASFVNEVPSASENNIETTTIIGNVNQEILGDRVEGQTYASSLPNSSTQAFSQTLPKPHSSSQSKVSSPTNFSSVYIDGKTGFPMRWKSAAKNNEPFKTPRGNCAKVGIQKEPKAETNKTIWKP